MSRSGGLHLLPALTETSLLRGTQRYTAAGRSNAGRRLASQDSGLRQLTTTQSIRQRLSEKRSVSESADSLSCTLYAVEGW
jgi:hypothetical protein